jgi:hypothetical protein
MTFNTKLLAGALALVLVAGMTSPAFAFDLSPLMAPNQDLIPQNDVKIEMLENIIFDNGGNPNVSGGNLIIESPTTIAEDFVLDEDSAVTDFHFVLDTFGGDTGDFTKNIGYFIFSDVDGQPGQILASGNLVDLEFEQINDRFATVWYFLDEPFEATGGIPYWIGISSEAGSDYAWSQTDVQNGSAACVSQTVPPTEGW